jgi:hypothetical protein
MYPFRGVGPRRNPGPLLFLDCPPRRRHVAHHDGNGVQRTTGQPSGGYWRPAEPNRLLAARIATMG